jgi:lysosomal alpha-mannosidase
VVPSGVQYGRTTVGGSSGSNLVEAKVHLTTGVVSAALISTPRAASSAYTTTSRDIEFQDITLNFRRYDSAAWTDTGVSLDWIAFPKKEIVNPVIPTTTALTANVINGPFVKSLQQVWRTGYAQTVRLFSDGSGDPKAQADFNHIRVSVDIGTIDSGAEVVTNWNTDIPTNGEFNGDANGLEIRPRKYNSSVSEPVAGNFYPFVQSASINGKSGGKDIQLTFVGDRARSVASLGNGNLQMMIHRRCLQDDGYGVGEVLDDQTKITVEFYVTLDNAQNTAPLRHRYQLLQNYPPLALVARATSATDYSSKYTTSWTALTAALPANLHLLTLEVRNPVPTGASPQGDTFVLLRLQHLFEQGESTTYSVPVTFNISNLFKPAIFTINTLQETILSGTLARSSLNRMQWRTNSPNPMDARIQPTPQTQGLLKDFVVTINPREIKTYRVNSSPLPA